MSALTQVVAIAVPPITGLAGVLVGARVAARADRERDLVALLNDAATALERADQRRDYAYVQFIQEGFSTSDSGVTVLNGFRQHLAEAATYRSQIAVRAGRESDVSRTYQRAVEALAEASKWLGVVAAMPEQHAGPGGLDAKDINDKVSAADAEFNVARDAFLDAAQAARA